MPRFMRKGITRFYWTPTIAAATKIPTATEVNNGTRLDPQIAEVAGFSFANSPITTPDMASTFTSQIPGEDTAADSSVTLYELRSETDTIKAALPKNANGFMVIFYGGITGTTPASGDKCDVWPATVSSNARSYTAGNEAAQYTVNFAMTATPAENVTITAV